MSQDKTNAILKEFEEFGAAPGMYSKQNLVSMTGIMQALFHVPDHLCRTCGEQFMPLRVARQPEKHRPKALIFKRRVENAVDWLRALLGDASRFKTQFAFAARAVTPQWSILADASPFGMGDILCSSELVPQAYWASELGKWDLERFCAQKGHPAFQSEWELLALFFSVLVFSDLVSASRCQISFVSDSKSALGAASRLRSLPALVGALAPEIALAWELVEVKHIHGTSNKSADACRGSVKEQFFLRCWTTCRVCQHPERETAFKVWPWRMWMGLAHERRTTTL